METVHVVPINDLKPHDDSIACACNPRLEFVEGGSTVVVHNSYDGREIFERAEEAVENPVSMN